MNNVTFKQIVSLLLMTAAMALILALLPDQPASSDGEPTQVSLVKQASK